VVASFTMCYDFYFFSQVEKVNSFASTQIPESFQVWKAIFALGLIPLTEECWYLLPTQAYYISLSR
jgi:hypothetical protein